MRTQLNQKETRPVPRCDHCGGRCFSEPDEQGRALICVNCGRTKRDPYLPAALPWTRKGGHL
jgi:hypothetical protein